ncbi:Crp/Fnr family transcriptional regulator [Sphingomonas sp. S-NIH.Pt15_0812]|jgi:CRP-like cAMP-binding protein|nr:Crp/Fnr family transcriptional regulator [Sphingomonas sp. S-NIH.Pt15_0812]
MIEFNARWDRCRHTVRPQSCIGENVSDHCFADRIATLIPLSAEEHAAIARLEDRERPVRRNGMVMRENERLTEMFVLRRGLMMSYMILDDGSRQILRFHFPGDLMGLTGLAFAKSQETIMALTESVVCPFERGHVSELVAKHPRIGMALMAFDQISRVGLTDRLAAVGRTSAKARVAALLLELRARSSTRDGSFALGVTQEEIGDATGLTAVHVNRMLRQLEEENLIARDNGRITVVNDQRLMRTAKYVDRQARIDLGWMPPAA